MLNAPLSLLAHVLASGAAGINEGAWQPDWQHTQSSKCVHLLRRLIEVGAAVPANSERRTTAKAIVYTGVRQRLPACPPARPPACLDWGTSAPRPLHRRCTCRHCLRRHCLCRNTLPCSIGSTCSCLSPTCGATACSWRC